MVAQSMELKKKKLNTIIFNALSSVEEREFSKFKAIGSIPIGHNFS